MNVMQTRIKLFFTLSMFLCSLGVYACDICSCGSSNSNSFANVLGGNYVGFSYNYLHFQSIQNYANDAAPLANDHTHTLSLTTQYQMTDRIQVNTLLPYKFNERINDAGVQNNRGLGDISVYGLIDLLPSANHHRLKFGMGVKLPTGSFDIENTNPNQISAIQLGTGSLDVLLPFQYHYTQSKWAVNLSAMYFVKGKNKDEFKFGNQTQINLSSTYVFSTGHDFSVAPIIGFSYDSFLAAERFGIVDKRTKGYMANANLGIQLETDHMILGIHTQQPIAQNLVQKEVLFDKGIGVYTYWKF